MMRENTEEQGRSKNACLRSVLLVQRLDLAILGGWGWRLIFLLIDLLMIIMMIIMMMMMIMTGGGR